MSGQRETTVSRNFTLRLSPDDQTRLARLAERLQVDRTGVLRLLIRRAVPGLTLNRPTAFIPVSRSSTVCKALPIQLRLRGGQR